LGEKCLQSEPGNAVYLLQGFIKLYIYIVVHPPLETLKYFIAVIAPNGEDKGKAEPAGVTLVQIRECTVLLGCAPIQTGSRLLSRRSAG
jgi:hypothetical protein